MLEQPSSDDADDHKEDKASHIEEEGSQGTEQNAQDNGDDFVDAEEYLED